MCTQRAVVVWGLVVMITLVQGVRGIQTTAQTQSERYRLRLLSSSSCLAQVATPQRKALLTMLHLMLLPTRCAMCKCIINTLRDELWRYNGPDQQFPCWKHDNLHVFYRMICTYFNCEPFNWVCGALFGHARSVVDTALEHHLHPVFPCASAGFCIIPGYEVQWPHGLPMPPAPIMFLQEEEKLVTKSPSARLTPIQLLRGGLMDQLAVEQGVPPRLSENERAVMQSWMQIAAQTNLTMMTGEAEKTGADPNVLEEVTSAGLGALTWLLSQLKCMTCNCVIGFFYDHFERYGYEVDIDNEDKMIGMMYEVCDRVEMSVPPFNLVCDLLLRNKYTARRVKDMLILRQAPTRVCTRLLLCLPDGRSPGPIDIMPFDKKDLYGTLPKEPPKHVEPPPPPPPKDRPASASGQVAPRAEKTLSKAEQRPGAPGFARMPSTFNPGQPMLYPVMTPTGLIDPRTRRPWVGPVPPLPDGLIVGPDGIPRTPDGIARAVFPPPPPPPPPPSSSSGQRANDKDNRFFEKESKAMKLAKSVKIPDSGADEPCFDKDDDLCADDDKPDPGMHWCSWTSQWHGEMETPGGAGSFHGGLVKDPCQPKEGCCDVCKPKTCRQSTSTCLNLPSASAA